MSDKFAGGILAGATSVSVPFVLRKTADNTETTGKVASDMTLSYMRQGGVRVAITASDLAAVNSAFSSGGVKEVDATNQPGLYRLDVPDAAFATGADWVVVTIKVASSYIYHERFALTTNVVQSGDAYARLGAPANASVSADVAAVKVDTAAIKVQSDKLTFTVANHLDVNVLKWIGGTIPAVNVTGVPLVDLKYTLGTISPATAGSVRSDSVTGAVGSVTGNVGGNVVGSVASVTARVTANTDQLAGETVTAAAGVTFPASVASPTNITAGTITTVTNLTNAATAGDLTATMKTSVTTAATAATPTAAAVTGAVGSVAGLTAADVGAIKAKTDNLPGTPAATGDAMTLTSAYDFAKGTVAMTESYAAAGATMTPAQAMYMIWSLFAERSIASTTLTAKKLDGSTTAMTFTLDDATTPTAQTRAT